MKKLLSILAISLFSSSAFAEVKDFAKIPGWDISTVTDDAGNNPLCVSSTEYTSGLGLGFVFSSSGISMYLSDVAYRREYDVLFTDDKGRTFRMAGRPDNEGDRMVMFDNLSTKFVDAAMSTKYLKVEGFERSLSMRGSKRMFDKGFECFLSVSNSGSRVPDSKPEFDNAPAGKTAL